MFDIGQNMFGIINDEGYFGKSPIHDYRDAKIQGGQSWQEKAVTMDLYQSSGGESEGEKGAGKEQGKKKEDAGVGTKEPQTKGENENKEGEKTGSERGRARG